MHGQTHIKYARIYLQISKFRPCSSEIPDKIYFSLDNCKVKVKGKAIPLQAWTGPEGSRRVRFPDFKIMARESGKVVSPKHRPPLPQEIFLVLNSVRG